MIKKCISYITLAMIALHATAATKEEVLGKLRGVLDSYLATASIELDANDKARDGIVIKRRNFRHEDSTDIVIWKVAGGSATELFRARGTQEGGVLKFASGSTSLGRCDGNTLFIDDNAGNTLQLTVELAGSRIAIQGGTLKDGLRVSTFADLSINGSLNAPFVDLVTFKVTQNGVVSTSSFKATVGPAQEVINKGTIQSDQGLVLEGSNFINKGQLKSKQDMVLKAELNLDNMSNGSIVSEGNLLGSGKILDNFGTISVQGDCELNYPSSGGEGSITCDRLIINSKAFVNKGTLIGKSSVLLNQDGQSRDIFQNERGGKIISDGTVAITTKERWGNFGDISAKSILYDQEARSFANVGRVVATETLAIKVGSVTSFGTLSAPNLQLTTQQLYTAGKLLMGEGQSRVAVQENFRPIGTLSCAGDCVVSAPSVETLSTTTVSAGGHLLLDAQSGSNVNSGTTLCTGDCEIKGKTQVRNEKLLVTDGSAKMTSGTDVANTGEIKGSGSYTAQAASNFQNTGSVNVGSDVTVTAGANVDNKNVVAANNVVMTAGQALTNDQGSVIQSDQSTTLKADKVNNAGKVDAGTSFDIQAQTVENTPTGELRSQGSGTITAEKSLANEGKILTKEDLTIFVQNGLFKNDKGTVNTGGQLQIDANEVYNIAGRLLVGQLLVHAKVFKNDRAPTVMQPGEYCPMPPVGRGLTCQGAHEEESSGPGIVFSKGNIRIEADNLQNTASTLYAKGTITLQGRSLANLAHNLANYKVTKSWRHEKDWLGDVDHIPNIETRNEPKYVGATLTAEGDIVINGTPVEGNDGARQVGMTSTGNVKAHGTFNLAFPGEAAAFINGLFDETNPTANRQTVARSDYKVYSYMNDLGDLYYFCYNPASNELKYILVPCSETDETKLKERIGKDVRALNEPTQFAYVGDRLEGGRFVMHSLLAAQVVESMLVTELGCSRLKGMEEKDALTQYYALESRGYAYAHSLASNGGDVLPLTPEQIAAAKDSFIYYDTAVYHNDKENRDEKGYVPVLHIGSDDLGKYKPGTEGTVEANHIRIAAPIVKNTGTLLSEGDLTIRANTFENQQRIYKTYETVHESKGFLRGTRTRVFEVRTPQIGGNIIGYNVEIATQGDTTFIGGLVHGTQSLYVVSQEGNIQVKRQVATRVVHWDPGSWGRFTGKESAALATDFVAAVLSTGEKGGIVLETKQRDILIQASKLLAGGGGIQVLAAGSATVTGATAKWKSGDSAEISRLGVDSKTTESFSKLPAVVAAKGDVVFKAGGTLTISGTQITSTEGSVSVSGKNVIMKPVTITYQQTASNAGLHGFSVGGSETAITREAFELTTIQAAKDIFIKSEEDNLFEGVLMGAGRGIYIVAGRNNLFKAYTERATIDNEGWSVGISFFGSEALQALGDDPGVALGKLADEDPLLRSLHSLGSAKDGADIGANSVKSLMEAYRFIRQLNRATGAGTSKMGTLGQRLKLTNAEGKFSPVITLTLGVSDSSLTQTTAHKTEGQAQTVEIVSKGDTFLLDGTSFTADERVAITTGGHLITGPAEDTSTTDSSSTTVGVAFAPQPIPQASHAESERTETTRSNVHLAAPQVDLNIGGNLNGQALSVNANNATLNVAGDATFASTQNTAQGNGYAWHASTGGSIGGSVTHEDTHRTQEVAGIHATGSLKVRVGGTLYLIGSVLDGPPGATDVSAKELRVVHLEDSEDVRSFGFDANLPGDRTTWEGKDEAILGDVDLDFRNRQYRGTTQATLSPEANLQVTKVTDDLKNLNRVMDQIQQTHVDDHEHFRAFLPLLNLKKVGEDIDHLKEMLKREAPPAEAKASRPEVSQGVAPEMDASKPLSDTEKASIAEGENFSDSEAGSAKSDKNIEVLHERINADGSLDLFAKYTFSDEDGQEVKVATAMHLVNPNGKSAEIEAAIANMDAQLLAMGKPGAEVGGNGQEGWGQPRVPINPATIRNMGNDRAVEEPHSGGDFGPRMTPIGEMLGHNKPVTYVTIQPESGSISFRDTEDNMLAIESDAKTCSNVQIALKALAATWNNPRFQGGLEVLGGFGEATAGATTVAVSGGLATPLGALAMAHGSDHFAAGLVQLITGQDTPTFTKRLLMEAGASDRQADVCDAAIGFGTMFTGAVKSGVNVARGVSGEMTGARAATRVTRELPFGDIVLPVAKAGENIAQNTLKEVIKSEATVKAFWKPLSEVEKRAIAQTLKPHLQDLIRYAEIEATPGVIKLLKRLGFHRHHVFPQKFATHTSLTSIGFDINCLENMKMLPSKRASELGLVEDLGLPMHTGGHTQRYMDEIKAILEKAEGIFDLRERSKSVWDGLRKTIDRIEKGDLSPNNGWTKTEM